MLLSRFVFVLFALIAIFGPGHAIAANGTATYAGGAFTTGTSTGSTISVTSAALLNNKSKASITFSCPITGYTLATYSTSWTCAGGAVTIASSDHSLSFNGSFVAGTMTFTASGGGRGSHVVGDYQFTGSFGGSITAAGVTQYSYGSVAQSVQTGGQLGGASAPVSSGSFGWNSGYAPLLAADSSSSKLYGADNINGANLVVSGSPGTGVLQFGNISGLAKDASSRIYVLDSTLNRLVRMDDQSGRNWVTLGAPGSGTRQFSNPHGIAIDALGRIYIADTANHRVVRFNDISGAQWVTIGSLGSGKNQFDAPSSIALDAQGRIYVADTNNNRVVRFDDIYGANWLQVQQLTVSGIAYPLYSPASIAVSPLGQVYVGLGNGYLLSASDVDGSHPAVSYWGPRPVTALATDSSGTLYVGSGQAPGLAQVLDAAGTGYFPAPASLSGLQVGAILALSTTEPTPAAASLSADSLAFGNQAVGTRSAPQSLGVINLGAAPLTFESAHTSNDFTASTNCPAVLPAGASCSGAVVFEPVTTGARDTSLTITMKGVHTTKQIALTGTGTSH